MPKKTKVSPLLAYANWEKEYSEDSIEDFDEQNTEVIENYMKKSSELIKKDQLFPQRASERISKTSRKSETKALKTIANEIKAEM